MSDNFAIVLMTAIAIAAIVIMTIVAPMISLRCNRGKKLKKRPLYPDELLRSKWVCSSESMDMVHKYCRVVGDTIYDIAYEIAKARGSKYKDTNVTSIKVCDVQDAIVKMELGVDRS